MISSLGSLLQPLTLLLSLCHLAAAQRGCPMQGCDSRGLYCQADFEITGTGGNVLWSVSSGHASGDVIADGCVGNAANIVCKYTSTKDPSVVSYASLTPGGKVKWVDDVMVNPELPALESVGNIIATDGHNIEMRLSNGSLVGNPYPYYGSLAPMSSILWVQEDSLFFFVSYQQGLLLLYDTSGMCVASHYLDEKDPVTNQTVSTWIPQSRVVVNSQLDPVTAYFLATNNKTAKHRLIALRINHGPPYLWPKWFVPLPADLGAHVLSETRLLALDHRLFLAVGGSQPRTFVYTDVTTAGLLTATLPLKTRSFAAFDLPVSSPRRRNRPDGAAHLVWMAATDRGNNSYVIGWDSAGVGAVLYNYSVEALTDSARITFTSDMMVFGFHPSNTSLVLAVTGTPRQADSPRNILLSLRPQGSGAEPLVSTLWSSSDEEVVGQLIGLDSMLVATTNRSSIIAIQPHD